MTKENLGQMPEFKFTVYGYEGPEVRIMETWASLLEAIEEAGGYLPRTDLPSMQVKQLISLIGPNNIRFYHFKGKR